ncbi:MarR family transcriptional regulator [Agromyces archimandritae]|uniref:MarR family transcriptional regulator n=2 Tax=Agromyces archimandritae TaxID=2781962 RepID=A0A975IQE8_9MICO|nr:MarR family transcriptional regulator [Agromyces archimandritae]
MRALTAEFPSEIISLNEYDVMFILSRQEDRSLRLRDINRMTLITQPSVSRLVDRLVARGLLAKRDDPSDGRGTIVSLTDAGFDLFRRVAVSHMQSITTHMQALDDDELRELTALSDKIRTGVHDSAAPGTPLPE